MGEQPIWTTRAQIFEIDRATKTSWLPYTKQTVSISFYHDPNRKTYRIISVDGSKAILNSTITSDMIFTKTAQKFGQWSDPKAATIYGVGFPNEDDLKKFEDIFKKAHGSVKALDVKQESATSSLQAVSTNTTSVTTSNPTPVQNGSSKPKDRSSSVNSGGSGGSTNQEESSMSAVNGTKLMSTSIDAQLKYENDKLKLALAQSSANAKKWETELQNLRNNNARLTTALQESTANVEEWKKQLLMYKEENTRLRTRVQELDFLQQESGKSFGNVNQLQSEKSLLEHKVVSLESSIEQQSQEIASMTLQFSELQNVKLSNNELAERVRDLKLDNERLQSATDEFSTKARTMAEQEGKLTELRELFSKLDTHVDGLNSVQELVRQKLTV